MGLMGREIRMIPLAVKAPPIMTPRDRTVGLIKRNAPTSIAAQMTVPVIHRPIPMMSFNSDPP